MPIIRRTACFLAVILLLGLHTPALIGQDSSATKTALTNQDVMGMVKTGLSQEVVLAKIKVGPCGFDTTPDALKALKAADVPDAVILAMVEASAATMKMPVTTEPNLKPAAGLELAHLRVYRQRRFVGAALAPSIYIDGTQIARVGDGRRCTIKLTAGTHTVRSDDKSSVISIEAKAGEEYFVRVEEATGFWKGHGKLTMVPAEQGAPEYKLQKPVEADRKIATDMIEEDTAPPESK